MAIKLTKNYFSEDARANAIRLGYCEIPYLLRAYERIGYNAGVYGWNYDAFIIDGLVITTGYRNMFGHRQAVDPAPYEEAARKIWSDWRADYDTQKKEVRHIMHDWLKACGKIDF